MRSIALTTLLVLTALICSTAAMAQSSSRIISGVPANTGEHDYYVAFMLPWTGGPSYLICGAVHIGNGEILTAAHCVDEFASTQPIELLIGNNSADMGNQYCRFNVFGAVVECVGVAEGDTPPNGYIETGSVVYIGDEEPYQVTVGDFVKHQYYSASTLRHDIAYLQLDSVPANAALQLPETDLFEAMADSVDSVMVVGHGYTSSEVITNANCLDYFTDSECDSILASGDEVVVSTDPSSTLLEATLTPRTGERCAAEMSVFGVYDADTMICAGDQSTDTADIQDSCQGDSGGPLFDPTTGTLLGLVSWGSSLCANPSLPFAVYTNIYNYLEWIELDGDLPIGYESGGEVIRLGNEAGALHWLWLLLPALLVGFRKL